jgi:hypothetical protein
VEWIGVKDRFPPDTRNIGIEVRDVYNNTALAIPSYYNFSMVQNKIVFHEPRFGGWLIQSNGIEAPNIKEITHWRH